MDPLKKEKSVKKSFFEVMLNKVLKMVSADINANVKQEETK